MIMKTVGAMYISTNRFLYDYFNNSANSLIVSSNTLRADFTVSGSSRLIPATRNSSTG